MRAIRRRDTTPELQIRSLLHRAGLRYRDDQMVATVRANVPRSSPAAATDACRALTLNCVSCGEASQVWSTMSATVRPVAGPPEPPPPEVLPPDPQPAHTVDVMTTVGVVVMSDAFRRDNVVRSTLLEPLRLPKSDQRHTARALRHTFGPPIRSTR